MFRIKDKPSFIPFGLFDFYFHYKNTLILNVTPGAWGRVPANMGTWLILQGTSGYSSLSTWQKAKELAAPIVRKPVPGISSFSPAPPVAQKQTWNTLTSGSLSSRKLEKWSTCYESVGGVSVVSHQREEGLPGHEGAEEERLHHLQVELELKSEINILYKDHTRDLNHVHPPSGGPSGTGCVGVLPATSWSPGRRPRPSPSPRPSAGPAWPRWLLPPTLQQRQEASRRMLGPGRPTSSQMSQSLCYATGGQSIPFLINVDLDFHGMTSPASQRDCFSTINCLTKLFSDLNRWEFNNTSGFVTNEVRTD